jgi:hypothetical protein
MSNHYSGNKLAFPHSDARHQSASAYGDVPLSIQCDPKLLNSGLRHGRRHDCKCRIIVVDVPRVRTYLLPKCTHVSPPERGCIWRRQRTRPDVPKGALFFTVGASVIPSV